MILTIINIIFLRLLGIPLFDITWAQWKNNEVLFFALYKEFKKGYWVPY